MDFSISPTASRTTSSSSMMTIVPRLWGGSSARGSLGRARLGPQEMDVELLPFPGSDSTSIQPRCR